MRLGPLQLPLPVCQAGLAGYSDRAMRLVARRRGCPYALTEALLDTILINGGQGLRRSLDLNEEDHPLGGQIIGSEPASMAQAAVILYRAGHDVIDLNFACPVKKIRNRARGGHMLRDAKRAIAVLEQVRQALPDAPLSVSLRRGFDDSAPSAELFETIVSAACRQGFMSIRVHARTVEQKYLGQADWEFLRQLKLRYPQLTLWGSGDVLCAADAVRLLAQTGVDGAWIARGAIGNPWIFQQIASLLLHPHQPLQPPTLHQQAEALLEHFTIATQIHGQSLAARRMRKFGIKYARFHPLCPQVKEAFIQVHSLREWIAVLDKFYADDSPGVWPAPNAADEVNDCQHSPS